MDYGDPLAPRTVRLREEYRLDDVVAGCDTEFQAQRALNRWVRSRWNHGWSLSPVNACGRAGITSRLEVAYAPARW